MKFISRFCFPSFYLLHSYLWSSSSLQCTTTVWTPSHPPSSHSTFLIPCFLKHSTFQKGTSKLLSAIINHCSTLLTLLLVSLAPSTSLMTPTTLCGQSLSAFSYYPQATSSAASYTSIKTRNRVLFLSPIPSPCSLQQVVNTSNSQTAKIKKQDTFLPCHACKRTKITPYSTLSLYVRLFSPQKVKVSPFSVISSLLLSLYLMQI